MGSVPIISGLWPAALLASLPIALVFCLLGLGRVAGHRAALAGAAAAICMALGVWRYPLAPTLAAAAYGIATALFPILYIIAGSLLLYNLTVASGWAESLRKSLERTAKDRYLLLLLIGFGFAAFLDSTAGFLTPVTVATAMLVGLGVPAFEAAAYSLVASSLPPIFGAMGIPVVVLSEAAGVPLLPLVQAQASVAAGLFVFFPTWLTLTFGGWSAFRRLWAHSLAAGLAYSCALWLVAHRVSLYPAALAASVASLLATVMVAGWWNRRGGPTPERSSWLPWWPYLLLMGTVTIWSVPAVSQWLNAFTIRVPLPPLGEATAWRLDLLASPGTAIFVAAATFFLAAGLTRNHFRIAAQATLRQLRFPAVSMTAMFVLAQVMNFSGMTLTLGLAVANTGRAFPLLSPYLSWLGAAIAGSNTASNAMLGRLQAATAEQLGLDTVAILALAGAAAPLGKMVAPQVVSAAAGAAGQIGLESRLFRIGLFHSLIWTGMISVATWVIASWG